MPKRTTTYLYCFVNCNFIRITQPDYNSLVKMATGHYLNHCGHSFLKHMCVNRHQWVYMIEWLLGCVLHSTWWHHQMETLSALLAICADGLAQDCSIPIASALEILQSCTKPSISTNAVSLVTDSYHLLTKNNWNKSAPLITHGLP